MQYNLCPLYSVKTKKVLMHKLRIQDNKWLQQQHVAAFIYPCIDSTTGKPRLLEKPIGPLKDIQTRIKTMLAQLEYPEYVFSGVKGRSYIDNAKLHSGTKYVYKLDLTAFFPSISREKVYILFREKLCTASDVAEILTNLTTIDLDIIKYENRKVVDAFLLSKKIKAKNHLISGSPASQLLSYLANVDLFDKLHHLASINDIETTVYVDDIVFSAEHRISSKFKATVKCIIESQGYRLSTHKVKLYTRYYPKKVTGVIIDKEGKLTIPNALRRKIINGTEDLKTDLENVEIRRKLRGLVNCARQIKPGSYPSIHAFAFDPRHKIDRKRAARVVK